MSLKGRRSARTCIAEPSALSGGAAAAVSAAALPAARSVPYREVVRKRVAFLRVVFLRVAFWTVACTHSGLSRVAWLRGMARRLSDLVAAFSVPGDDFTSAP